MLLSTRAAPHERSPCPLEAVGQLLGPHRPLWALHSDSQEPPADTRADTSSFSTNLGSPAPTQGSRLDPGSRISPLAPNTE